MDKLSGTKSLRIEGTNVVYEPDVGRGWQFALSDLRLIGEWTTDQGPYVDDYFYGFAVGRPHRFYKAPLGANTSIVYELATALGQPLTSALGNSTDYRSRVIWPPALEGRDLFVYSPEARPSGVLNRLKDLAVPLIQSQLTDEVMEYLTLNSRSGAS